jgi:hypothetical protein
VSDDQTKVLLTRKRWDVYMLPLFAALVLFGALSAWKTGQLRFAAAPLGVLPLWAILRGLTPRDGMKTPTIRSTPGAVVMLWFSGAGILLAGALVAVDIYLIGHPFRAPLEPYHAILFTPPFILIFAGAYWADRIAKSKRNGTA